MPKASLLFLSMLLSACNVSQSGSKSDTPTFSDIKPDEHVVFFRTAAWLQPDEQAWHVPIHGWIYEPEDSVARKALFTAILKEKYDLAPNARTDGNFSRRLNLMIADNERGKQIVVSIAGRNVVLPPSAPNGQFETTLTIPASEAEKYVDGGLLRYSAIIRPGESRQFTGETRLAGPTGLAVISDIDDTVKISNVTERRSLLEHTFLLDFAAVPEMASRYREWAAQNASFHFVSSSPWQLYSPLLEFLEESDFPWATLNLKAVRFRDETLFDLFKKGTETKPKAIEAILGTYPDRKFILVGDSGEQDPEVYAALMRTHPEQILNVYIRNVTEESADDERFESLFENIAADRWLLFDDPSALNQTD